MSNRLRTLLYSYDSEWGEGFSALCAIWWGVWLLNPVWNTFQSSRSFDTMAYIAPEWSWGLGMVTLGCLSLFGLLANCHTLRVFGTGLTFSAWVFLGAAFMASNRVATSSVIYPLIAAMTGLAFYRLLKAR